MKQFPRPSIAALATAGLAAEIVVMNLIWVGLEGRPPHWDMARHLWTSLQYLDLGRHQPWRLFEAYLYYPPLVYLVALPFYLLLGTAVVVAVAANQVFLLVGMLAMYRLGRKISGSGLGGFLAALVFAASPLIASQFREFQIDGPLACITAVWLWCLVESDWFKKPGWSIAFGVASGLGMLCKWTFVAAIVLPLAAAVGTALWKSWRERSFVRLANLALAGVLAAAIIYPWYYPHRHQLRVDASANNAAQAALEGDPTGFTWPALTYYAKNLLVTQLYLPLLALFVTGAGLAVWRRKKELVLPALLFVGTYAAFSLLGNKDARYTLPFLPAVAVIAVWWIPGLRRRARMWTAGAVTAVALVTLWAMFFGVPWLPKQVAAGGTLVWAQHGYIVAQPSGEDWHLEESVKAAANSTLSYGGPDTIWLNSWGLAYYAAKYQVQLAPGGSPAGYVLIRSSRAAALPGYAIIKQYELPDKTVLTLHKRLP